jgi:hypothetical protein
MTRFTQDGIDSAMTLLCRPHLRAWPAPALSLME